MDEFILIDASDLRPGHVFPNGGTVQTAAGTRAAAGYSRSGPPTRVGSFVVVPVKTSRWSLATGTHVDVTEDLVLHASDEVYVQVPQPRSETVDRARDETVDRAKHLVASYNSGAFRDSEATENLAELMQLMEELLPSL